MTDTERLAALLEQAMLGGYVCEMPNEVVADRLLAAGVRPSPDDGPLRAAATKTRDLSPDALRWASLEDDPALDALSEATDYEVMALLRRLARAALEAPAPPPTLADEPAPGLREALERLEDIASKCAEITPDGRSIDPHPRMWHLLDDALEQARGALAATPSDARERPVALDAELREAVDDVLVTLQRVVDDSESQHPGGWGPDVTTVADLRDCIRVLRAATQPEPETER